MIPASTFHRMFHIQCGHRRGTAFSLDVQGRQYFITASHLLAPLQNQAPVELFHWGKWKPLDIVVVGVGPRKIDVAVLALKFRVTLPEFTLTPYAGSLTPGQTGYCLGFPLGERGEEKIAEQPFPIPFLKTVSVAHVTDLSDPIHCVFLDGYANPGFSGGPVLPGNGNNFCSRKIPGQDVGGFEAVGVGHDDIHDHQVGGGGTIGFQALAAVLRFQDRMPVSLQGKS